MHRWARSRSRFGALSSTIATSAHIPFRVSRSSRARCTSARRRRASTASGMSATHRTCPAPESRSLGPVSTAQEPWAIKYTGIDPPLLAFMFRYRPLGVSSSVPGRRLPCLKLSQLYFRRRVLHLRRLLFHLLLHLPLRVFHLQTSRSRMKAAWATPTKTKRSAVFECVSVPHLARGRMLILTYTGRDRVAEEAQARRRAHGQIRTRDAATAHVWRIERSDRLDLRLNS
jgi:hypothetical protein